MVVLYSEIWFNVICQIIKSGDFGYDQKIRQDFGCIKRNKTLCLLTRSAHEEYLDKKSKHK